MAIGIGIYLFVGLIMALSAIMFDRTKWYFWLFLFFLYPLYIAIFISYAIMVANAEPNKTAKKISYFVDLIRGVK